MGKTIPEWPLFTNPDTNTLFIIDSGTETFRLRMNELVLYLRDALLPAGMVSASSRPDVPPGWLLCDGSAVSRTTYSRLWAAIGTTYGSGDGSTTFHLPDFRGRVPVGKDDMGGTASGRVTSGVSGIDGAVLGATGGSQNSTGTIGGSQSISHTHAISHTHTFQHAHMWGRIHLFEGYEDWYTRTSSDPSSTSITNGNVQFSSEGDYSSGSGSRLMRPSTVTTSSRSLYTTGAISAPSGSGSTATTSASSSASSGAMSGNSTVSGSNFTFTATGSRNVQPSIIQNWIIKT